MKSSYRLFNVILLGLIMALGALSQDDLKEAVSSTASSTLSSETTSSTSTDSSISSSSTSTPAEPDASSPSDPSSSSSTESSTSSTTIISHPTPSTSTVTTTDVCGLSLVSPNGENDVKLQKCRCSNLNEDVDCSSLDVSELPRLISFPKSAREVTFKDNRIENIADDTFYNAKNVLELDLSHNRIDFISSKAFQGFKSLRELDLSHNKIWNMPSKSFQGLTELRYLDLSYNDLVTLSSDLFLQTTGLKQLILESNPLQELEPKVFEHLQNLEVLSLEATLLKVVPDHLFLFTPKLTRLDMSDNQLTDVPTEALRVLDHLKILQLSGNPISTINENAFLGLRNLVMLYLDRMPLLTRIGGFAFGNLVHLQELHCSYNFMLSEIDRNAFVKKADRSKIELQQLFLRQDSLESIPRGLLNWNPNMELHINDNPLYCDCNLEWMVNLKLKNEFQMQAKCFGPSYLTDVSISELKEHSLSCGMELTEIIMIAIAIVTGIIIIILIVAFLVWKRSFNGYTRPYFKVKKRNLEDIDYSI